MVNGALPTRGVRAHRMFAVVFDYNKGALTE